MSICSLGGEGVHGPRPYTVHRQGRPDVWASGRMSGPDWPNVQAVGVSLDAFRMEDAGFPGLVRVSGFGRMSGLRPDVRGL